jgi:hypothetical protein
MRRQTFIRFAAIGGALVLFAGWLGWGDGDVAPPDAARAAKEVWSLPRPRPDNAVKDLAIVTARQPWGTASGEARQAGGKAGEAPWRIAGTVERGGELAAILEIGAPGKGTFEYRAPGEALPDGSYVVQVAPDRVVAAPNAGGHDPQSEHVYRLFAVEK